MGGAHGDEEAGGEEADGWRVDGGGGDAGEVGVWRPGTRLTVSGAGRPLTRATVGGWPWGNSTVRRRRKWAWDRASLWRPISSKRREPSPRNDGDGGDGIPDDIAEAAQAGEGGRDFIPVGMESYIFGGAEGDETLGCELHGTGVGDIELKGSAGSEGRGEGNSRFVELAGVVGVGVEGGDGEGDSAAGDANLFPLREEEICRGMRVRGALPSLRTVTRARTAI